MRRFNNSHVFILSVVMAVVVSSTADLLAVDQVSLRKRFGEAPGDQAVVQSNPNFQRHIIPLLGKLGCNGRACHGSFQGQGGFRLSMFGFDFAEDHKSLVAGDPRRVDVDNARASLILKKPTSDDEHEGGQRFAVDGWEYRALRSWIDAGAKDDSQQAGRLERLEVVPNELVFARLDEIVQLAVTAHWEDGSREDVTCLTRFHSTDEGVTSIDEDGQARAVGKGDAHIVASYDSGVVSIPVMLPVSDMTGRRYPPVSTSSRVDELAVAKLRKLGVIPSETCTDEEFLRRVSLDVTGTLPTPHEVRAFCSDSQPEKRNLKVDELLKRPAYSVWWGTLFCDYTGLNAPLQLGNTDFAKPVGDQWTAWVERKLRENVPYDKMVEGIVVATSRKPGQSYEAFALEQSQFTRTHDPVDFAAQDQMPHFWQRENIKDPEQKALAFAYSFLGVRLDCAQCHKHPFDRWTKRDFDQFAACFERIRKGISPECEPAYNKLVEELGITKNTTAAERRGKYLRLAAEGKLAPWKEVFIGQPEKPKEPSQAVPPKILGGAELSLADGEDPRVKLMAWLRSKDNPYFAKAIVNRIWAQYFGHGLVDPPDDQNLGNPPSNGPLLDYLSMGFIDNGFDLKWLHRQITCSATYQRSCRTSATNRADERSFSRAIIRRLPAEVIVDALYQATSRTDKLQQLSLEPKNRRIGVQATADLRRTEFGLAVFGKPLRNTNCDCEREMSPSLLQCVYLRNDKDMLAALDRPDGWVRELKDRVEKSGDDLGASVDELIGEAFLRTISRQPTERELARARTHFEESPSIENAMHDLLWALINTQEFVTNH